MNRDKGNDVEYRGKPLGDFPLFSGTIKSLLGMICKIIEDQANPKGTQFITIKKTLLAERDFDNLTMLKKALKKGVDSGKLEVLGVSKSNYRIVGLVIESAVDDSVEISNDDVSGVELGASAAVSGDTVMMSYRACTMDGKRFDKGKSFRFTIEEGRVIYGWDKGVIGMKAGGMRTLTMTGRKGTHLSGLATWLGYGKNDPAPEVPENVPLVFHVKMNSIKPGGNAPAADSVHLYSTPLASSLQ